MKVLVTGAKGFVGQNLCWALKNIRDGKDQRMRYQGLMPLEVYEYDKDSEFDEFSYYCSQTDFVFNLAGVNRPKETSEFMSGNCDFASELLQMLSHHGNACPVMLASSTQASLEGRFAGSDYGKSKLAGENLFRTYAADTGAKVLVYRFPNLYGKWCRPNYNSAVATFCHNMANDLSIRVDDPSVELELLYIDDLVSEMLDALLGLEHHCSYEGLKVIPDSQGTFCYVPVSDSVSLGQIVDLLQGFKAARTDISIPDVAADSFSKKLYSTYLSYLNPANLAYRLNKNEDARGSFTEILRTIDRGQVSVNVSKPGITKGQHWHNTKWEKFCVVSGEGLIRLRQVGEDAEGKTHSVVEYQVSGDEPTVVEMVPGYTHSIVNLSKTNDLVTVMWCNEIFNPEFPDTYYEEV